LIGKCEGEPSCPVGETGAGSGRPISSGPCRPRPNRRAEGSSDNPGSFRGTTGSVRHRGASRRPV